MGSSVIPVLRYADAMRAVTWLEEAFGFEPDLVVPGEAGTIIHAQLSYGTGMVMLGSAKPEDADAVLGAGRPSGAVYVVVADADAHAATAEAAGAEIILPPTDQDYGGRDYTCRDFEGNVWSFGTYDPWSSRGA
jgi:uncharacterized glyoxalase superfamily protein PhnB